MHGQDSNPVTPDRHHPVRGDANETLALVAGPAPSAGTDAALAASEARYEALIGGLIELVVVTDGDGDVVAPQRSWNGYTGQVDAAAAGAGWRDAVHPDDRAALDARWEARIAAGRPFTISCRLWRSASDEHHLCDGRVVPLRDEAGVVQEWVAAITDVHERYIVQERERTAADRFRRIVSANVVAIAYGDGDRIVDANRAFLDIIRARPQDLKHGIPVEYLLEADALTNLIESFGTDDATEYKVKRLDGTDAYVLAAAVTLTPDPGWMAIAIDVTASRAAEQEAQHLALHDPLTGVSNRRLLHDRLEHALAQARRSGSPLAVLFCDLDRFKELNDRFGHSAGDHALQTVAQRLREQSRDTDTVARVGGDEFIVVLEELSDPVDATRVAERIRNALAEPIEYNGQTLHLTCSVGIAFAVDKEEDPLTLLGRADEAMYEAKQLGRDHVASIDLVDLEATSQSSERRWIERELNAALDDNGLDLAFQPVIDLRSGCPVAAEALLRWTVDGTQISPMRVIAVAEESGLIMRVSDWVMGEACRRFSDWREATASTTTLAPGEWRLHINVSARDLADVHFVERVLRAISGGGCLPSDVCLEVTETAVLKDPRRAQLALGQLRQLGAFVAIDDFGTGYASLRTLRDIQADIVKIDQSFVAELDTSARDRSIVRHTIDLAHELGMTVVAEGVETRRQIAILEDLGCDCAQGYAFAKPMPLQNLTMTV